MWLADSFSCDRLNRVPQWRPGIPGTLIPANILVPNLFGEKSVHPVEQGVKRVAAHIHLFNSLRVSPASR